MEDSWIINYNLAQAYFEHKGNLNIKDNYKTSNGYEYDENGIPLGLWLYEQKSLYLENRLELEKIKLLENLNISWILMESWDYKYNLACNYYHHYHNLDIKRSFTTRDGVNSCENGIQLGRWLDTQRLYYKKGLLNKKRIKLLNEIHIIWDKKEDKWYKYYQELLKYLEENHNLDMEEDYEVNGIKLGHWFKIQKALYRHNELSMDKKKCLDSLNVTVNKHDYEWDKMYDLAQVYFSKHGNLNIPQLFKTIDGSSYQEDGLALGKWISTQRQRYQQGKLKSERIAKLELLGINWVLKDNWDELYNLLKNYYECYHNIKVPEDFCTKNGITYDSRGLNLYRFILNQKSYRRKGELSEERLALLQELGIFRTYESWHDYYNLASNYYEYYGNLKIPKDFKTNDGINSCIDGVNLGVWINTQRYRQDGLSLERRELLNNIGMIWNTIKNRNDILEFCNLYNINYNKNKKVLSHIAYSKLISLTNYLLSINENITINGIMHPIYSMSMKDLEETYHVSLQDIIKNYEIKTLV